DRQEAQAQHAGDIEVEGDRTQVVFGTPRHIDDSFRLLADAAEVAGDASQDDADQDRTAHPPAKQNGNQQEAGDGQKNLGVPDSGEFAKGRAAATNDDVSRG